MKKILMIDGNSLLHRAFHALPLLQTSKGVYTNAVYGFCNMFFRLVKEQQPDYIAVAFDKKGPTFRHHDYSAYKATRAATAPELIGQFDLLKQILQVLNVRYIEIDSYEADDIIGTLSKKAEEQGLYSIIVTGDKDALQLVSENTHVMLTKKGISELEEYNPSKVKERYGIFPETIPDLKGLMGDPSDNIPGVPGIGEKTASKLLKEFGNIETLIENIDKLKGSIREKIELNAEQAKMSKQLATIFRDIDIDLVLEDLKLREPNLDELVKLFRELEFYTLLKKIEIPREKALIETKTVAEVMTLETIRGLAESEGENREIGLLLENCDFKGDQVNIYISTEEKCFFIPNEALMDEDLRQALKLFLENKNRSLITHDAKKTRKALKALGINFTCDFDIMLAAYLLNPSKTHYDLDTLTFEFLGMETKEIGIDKKTTLLFQLKDVLMKKLQEYEMTDLFTQVEIPLSDVLADMELEGFKVNYEKLQQLSMEFGRKLESLTTEIYDMAGLEFNINSPKQLGEILFEKLGLPVVKKKKTGYSTDAEVLEKLKPAHPIIEKILEYRFIMKMKSTYADGLMALVNRDTGKIYTSFNQTVTSTGRISSTEPNLQNIPVRTEIGKKIRGVFEAENEEHVLLSGDYSQIELRVLAHISGDENLIDAFLKDQDIHTKTASMVFGVSEENVTPLLRDRAKAVNFGIVYGISDYGLSQSLGISRKEAQAYIDAYFERYPGVRDYVRETIRNARLTGYVTTLFYRRRYIPEINSRNYNLRSFAERVAMNTPIQGTAADIIKIAMVKVASAIKTQNLKARLLLQIHDELIFDVPKDELDSVRQIVKNEMENAVSLKVPLRVDFKQGHTWEEL